MFLCSALLCCVSAGVPESGPGAPETRQSAGRPAAVPDLAGVGRRGAGAPRASPPQPGGGAGAGRSLA